MGRSLESLEKRRSYAREYRRAIPRNERNEAYRKWYEENREYVLAKNRARRKASGYKSKSNNVNYRNIIVQFLRERDGDICGECGLVMVDDFNIDHIIPRCKGGLDIPSNIRLVHKVCNVRRPRSSYGVD